MIFSTPLEVNLYARETLELPGIMKAAFPGAQAVVQPGNAEDLEGWISRAVGNKTRIIPRGAASSGMGGLTPLKKSVILDLTHLDRIIDVDEKKRTISFEAGLRWWSLKRFLNDRSLDLYTYPTSLFSTVGGWLSTGGYGINSFRFGHLADKVESIDVVTASGKAKTIVRDDPELRFFIGTEGQMGIISRVRLKVRELAPPRSALVFFDTYAEAAKFLAGLAASPTVRPVHVAFFDRHRLEHKNHFLPPDAGFPRRESVLVSFDGPSSEPDFARLVEQSGGTLAEDHLTSLLWNERFFPFSLRRFNPAVLGCETVLPIRNLARFIDRARAFGENYGLRLSTEATLIDRSSAVVFSIFPSDPGRISHFFHLFLSYSLARVASECGGKPYGVGIWNLPLVEKLFSAEDFRLHRQFKKENDPSDLLNSGKGFAGGPTVRPLLTLAYLMSSLFPERSLLGRGLAKMLGRLEKDGVRSRPDPSRDLAEPDACASCGACTVVCPSYLINKTETVAAKGKLYLLKQLESGKELPKELRDKVFLCLHCHLCEYVCQTRLKLNPVWEKLESRLEKEFGRPTARIDEFVKLAETHPEYSALLDSLNLPRNGSCEDSPNV